MEVKDEIEAKLEEMENGTLEKNEEERDASNDVVHKHEEVKQKDVEHNKEEQRQSDESIAASAAVAVSMASSGGHGAADLVQYAAIDPGAAAQLQVSYLGPAATDGANFSEGQEYALDGGAAAAGPSQVIHVLRGKEAEAAAAAAVAAGAGAELYGYDSQQEYINVQTSSGTTIQVIYRHVN